MKVYVLTVNDNYIPPVIEGCDITVVHGVTPTSKNFLDLSSNRKFIASRLAAKKELSSGEQCCSLGHYMIWEKVRSEVAEGDLALVVEDDFTFIEEMRDNFILLMHRLVDIDFDFAIAGRSKTQPGDQWRYNLTNPFIRKENIDSGIFVGTRMTESTVGTVGYFIRSGIKLDQFLSNQKICLADDWLLYKELGFEIKHISPMLIWEGAGRDSLLEHDRSNIGKTKLIENPALRFWGRVMISQVSKYINKLWGR